MISKYDLSKRVSVVCADVRTQEVLLKEADVVIFNNVFEYFLKSNEMSSLWKLLRNSLTRPGTLVLSSPPLEEVFSSQCSKEDFKLLTEWLRYVKVTDAQNYSSTTALYEVI
jgi:chemotaxis methyl-accepting protein methylase